MTTLRLGIIGDFDGRPGHLATQSALEHAAGSLGARVAWEWFATEKLLEPATAQRLAGFDRILCGPGSPYRNLEGALEGIRIARERLIPFLGTCGGCQHAILELARNKLGVARAEHAETAPAGAELWVSPLACRLGNDESRIRLSRASLAARAYGGLETTERFRCNYGMSPERELRLAEAGLRVAGHDEGGQAVVFELAGHPFFVGTLFQPQLSSTPERPHPLITALLSGRGFV